MLFVRKPTDLRHWTEERIRDMLFKVNRHFRKQLQTELSWRRHERDMKEEALAG